jgi:beta-N-acetylhexosaminidase
VQRRLIDRQVRRVVYISATQAPRATRGSRSRLRLGPTAGVIDMPAHQHVELRPCLSGDRHDRRSACRRSSHVDIAGIELDAGDRDLLLDPRVGSVILFARNYVEPQQLARLTEDIHGLRDPPLIVAVDHEGGRVQRFRRSFSALPAARLIGHQYDMNEPTGLELARNCAWLLAAELRAVGVDQSFAPVVDLDYAVSEVIGDRAFHRDPEAVAALAAAWVAGMREAGMAAVAKHFPGHGAVVADSHTALPVDRRQLADLEAELTPYRHLIANGLTAIMVAHVAFPEVDPLPASLSARWITDILRGELQFHGVVFADDLNMAGRRPAS